MTAHNSPAVSLLYPESMLFPSIYFKNALGDSSLGCIPHYFCILGPSTSHNGAASVENRTYIRIHDGSLATSTSD